MMTFFTFFSQNCVRLTLVFPEDSPFVGFLVAVIRNHQKVGHKEDLASVEQLEELLKSMYPLAGSIRNPVEQSRSLENGTYGKFSMTIETMRHGFAPPFCCRRCTIQTWNGRVALLKRHLSQFRSSTSFCHYQNVWTIFCSSCIILVQQGCQMIWVNCFLTHTHHSNRCFVPVLYQELRDDRGCQKLSEDQLSSPCLPALYPFKKLCHQSISSISRCNNLR